MSDRSNLFRQEALEFRARGESSSGSVIRLGAPWLRWSYRLLLALIAAGVLVSFLLHTEESSTGPAVVDGRRGTFSALLPAVVAPDLRSARGLRIRIKRPGATSVPVKVTRARQVAAQTPLRGLPTPTQPSILLSGRLQTAAGARALPTKPRLVARATLVLRSIRLGEVVTRRFMSILDGGGGS